MGIEYFATQWFLTLFTYDLSIENIATVIDLFMVEGFKCLIKTALAILNYIYKIHIERGDNQDSFVESLKHFSEVLKPESHNLLNQACQYKITSKLMNDLEKLYYNEKRL